MSNEWLTSFRHNAQRDIDEGVQLPPVIAHPSPLVPVQVPRRMWIYWAQGWDQAPPLARSCRTSWERSNPDWDITVLDDVSAATFVDTGDLLDGKVITTTGRSDLLRMRLLARYGGVWVDASTFCSRPLADWLLPLMQSGFFAFARPGADRALSTWFLAAEIDNKLMARWLLLAERYWASVTEADFYFWAHYLFAEGCRTDPAMAAIWNRTPQVSADGPHQVQFRADEENAHDVRMSLMERRVPVHKLDSRRAKFPTPGEQTPLAWLLHGSAALTHSSIPI